MPGGLIARAPLLTPLVDRDGVEALLSLGSASQNAPHARVRPGPGQFSVSKKPILVLSFRSNKHLTGLQQLDSDEVFDRQALRLSVKNPLSVMSNYISFIFY